MNHQFCFNYQMAEQVGAAGVNMAAMLANEDFCNADTFRDAKAVRDDYWSDAQLEMNGYGMKQVRMRKPLMYSVCRDMTGVRQCYGTERELKQCDIQYTEPVCCDVAG